MDFFVCRQIVIFTFAANFITVLILFFFLIKELNGSRLRFIGEKFSQERESLSRPSQFNRVFKLEKILTPLPKQRALVHSDREALTELTG